VFSLEVLRLKLPLGVVEEEGMGEGGGGGENAGVSCLRQQLVYCTRVVSLSAAQGTSHLQGRYIYRASRPCSSFLIAINSIDLPPESYVPSCGLQIVAPN
jgi:hypothetical protein